MMSTDSTAGGGAAFGNELIEVADLPRLSEERFQPLDPRFLQIRWAVDGIVAAVIVIAALVATAVVPGSSSIPGWVPSLVAVVLLAFVGLMAWLQMVEVAHLGYLVREKDFSFRKGVISRTVTTVPFARIQHVSIDRGPLARAFGLATLQMRTAGGGLTVSGMGHETAQQLKALVVDRAGVAADEELAQAETPSTRAPTPPPQAASPATNLTALPAPTGAPMPPSSSGVTGPTELP